MCTVNSAYLRCCAQSPVLRLPWIIDYILDEVEGCLGDPQEHLITLLFQYTQRFVHL